jgi:hypothetical protein
MDPNTTVGGDTVSTQSSPVDGMNDQLENNGTNGIPPPLLFQELFLQVFHLPEFFLQ